MKSNQNSIYTMPCGCEFKLLSEEINPLSGLPHIDIDYYNLPLDCDLAWDTFKRSTKGVFQLETNLGQTYSKKLGPENLEDLGALGAILRPGVLKCISGNTKITTKIYDRKTKGGKYKRIEIKKIFDVFNKNHHLIKKNIVSIDETKFNFINNKIKNVIYNGKQDVFKPKFKSKLQTDKSKNKFKIHDLECTLEHKLFKYNYGWIELKHLKIGDRVAILSLDKSFRHHEDIKNKFNFRNICFNNYIYKCLFCDWKEASLDVNHIDGNRESNNQKENLCFLCPNHHRMYTERLISKEELISKQQEYKINNTEDIIWAEFTGYDYIGKKDVYDIEVEGPNHNFLAGNVLVHNCIVDGKSMTQHFVDRKNKVEEPIEIDPSITDILKETQQILVYQEETLQIAQKIAGFDLKQADILRRAMGKKIPELMTQVEAEFIEGVKKTGIVTEEKGREIWDMIRKSERYSFNKSHSISYGLAGYWSAYLKSHFPLLFFTSWLSFAKYKIDGKDEIKQLVRDAKYHNIKVNNPSIFCLFADFTIKNKEIYFGISNIKGIGESQFGKLLKAVQELKTPIEKMSWTDMLINLLPNISKTIVINLISAGGFDHFKYSRSKMLYDYNIVNQLTDKELRQVRECGEPRLLDKISLIKASKVRQKTISGLIVNLRHPSSSLDDNPIWVNKTEEDLLGIPLSITKLDTCENIDADTTCKEFRDGKEGSVTLNAEIIQCKEITIKKGDNAGQKMAFLSIEDDSGVLDDVAVFNNLFESFKNILYKGNTVAISGYRSKKNSLILEKICQI